MSFRMLAVEGGQRDALKANVAPDLGPAVAGLNLDWEMIDRISYTFVGAPGVYATREDRVRQRVKLLRDAAAALAALADDKRRYRDRYGEPVDDELDVFELEQAAVARALAGIEQELQSRGADDPLPQRMPLESAHTLALYDLVSPLATRPERQRHREQPRAQPYNETAMSIVAALMSHYYGEPFTTDMVRSRLQSARKRMSQP
jgi:hypothetical protein